MFLKKIKDKLYYLLVLKNEAIRAEYQGYVNSHPGQHKANRLKSWWLLTKLNTKYRLLKKESTPIRNTNGSKSVRKVKLPYLEGAESQCLDRQNPLYFAKELIKYDIISFDIFDTLILRPFAKPSDMFMIIGNRLKCMDFMRIRIEAEREARQFAIATKGNHEVTIYDIYKIVERKTGINQAEGVKTEFEVELEYCFANPYMMRIYKLLQEQKKEIVITSDMYLPHDMMKQLLEKCGYENYKKLYVSCDYNCNKRNGGLYKNLLKEQAVNKSIIHVGDNKEADIKKAQELGIATKYYKNVHEIGNEYRADGLSELTGSAYAGIVNTHLHNGIKTYSPYYEYGFIYGGLYVVGFCNWIYQKAKKEGVEKVLFLSRDGEIYQKVFNRMFQDMPNEYVYWSRIANIKYSIERNKEDFLTRMVTHKAASVIPVTISAVLQSIGLQHMEKNLSKSGLSGDMVLVSENAKLFEDFFIDNWDEVIKSYEVETNQMKNIIKDIIGSCNKVAVIDVGWIGSGPLGIKYLVEEKWGLNCKVECWIAASRHGKHTANINQLINEETVPYMFSRIYNRNLYDTHTGNNKGTNSIYFEFFTQAPYPSFSGINSEGNFEFDIPEVENYSITKQIHEGIWEFSNKYIEVFKNDSYLYNISGYDAYAAFRISIRRLDFIKKYFSDYVYARGVSGDVKNQKLETLGEIIRKSNI